jgi:4a-hydroxytetrahydrobiopterin dehydratase
MYSLVELTQKMVNLKDWTLESESIVKVSEFENFNKAIEFVNKVAEIAQNHNHHPEIIINFNTVRLTLTTHSVKSLSEKDFIVAEEIDKININEEQNE